MCLSHLFGSRAKSFTTVHAQEFSMAYLHSLAGNCGACSEMLAEQGYFGVGLADVKLFLAIKNSSFGNTLLSKLAWPLTELSTT